jgi:hypothetical protein
MKPRVGVGMRNAGEGRISTGVDKAVENYNGVIKRY